MASRTPVRGRLRPLPAAAFERRGRRPFVPRRCRCCCSVATWRRRDTSCARSRTSRCGRSDPGGRASGGVSTGCGCRGGGAGAHRTGAGRGGRDVADCLEIAAAPTTFGLASRKGERLPARWTLAASARFRQLASRPRDGERATGRRETLASPSAQRVGSPTLRLRRRSDSRPLRALESVAPGTPKAGPGSVTTCKCSRPRAPVRCAS